MLKLSKKDADSFAQHAEMYYKKIHELIIMVEDFYKTHRSLLERKSEVEDPEQVKEFVVDVLETQEVVSGVFEIIVAKLKEEIERLEKEGSKEPTNHKKLREKGGNKATQHIYGYLKGECCPKQEEQV
ncbi:hypothetical protein GIB67_026377 [Kingdonia uniflora]|uniref:NAB domain-containing protein n=1 Tax=Kingdonia uniflora TaxID=39325 RepID=A0A7J7P617_9MAGN|nr:hypothetical protein GIB67_026377 [Kingdonia uniflora]